MKQDAWLMLNTIAPVAYHDGLRNIILLYALDAQGRVWLAQDGTWTLIGNPTVEDVRSSTAA